jgi:hypothetical protein
MSFSKGESPMPISLGEHEILTVPARQIPETQAHESWLGLVVLHVPKSGKWTAVTEGHPIDSSGNIYQRHPVTGADTTLRIESQDLMADAAKSPVLAAAIQQVMSGIITAATEIKALRDAEKRALEEQSSGEEIPS